MVGGQLIQDVALRLDYFPCSPYGRSAVVLLSGSQSEGPGGPPFVPTGELHYDSIVRREGIITCKMAGSFLRME